MSPLDMRIFTGLKVLEANSEELERLIKLHHHTYSSDYAASTESLDLYDKTLQPLLGATILL